MVISRSDFHIDIHLLSVVYFSGTQRDTIPSIQALINCGHAGTCNGGNSNAANAYVYKNGIPDVSCQQYQAKNMECSDINTCMNCDHDTGECCKFIRIISCLWKLKSDGCVISTYRRHHQLPQGDCV